MDASGRGDAVADQKPGAQSLCCCLAKSFSMVRELQGRAAAQDPDTTSRSEGSKRASQNCAVRPRRRRRRRASLSSSTSRGQILVVGL